MVIVIVILFIGVGVYPAVAVKTESIMANNEFEDDCSCETIDNINLYGIGGLINRLEFYTEKCVLLLPKYDTEIADKCFEVSNGIAMINYYYKEFVSEVSSNDYPIICAILENMLNSIINTAYFLDSIIDYLDQFFPLFGLIAALLEFPIIFLAIIGYFVEGAGWNLNCDWAI